jgi:hypothetical protein
MSTPRRRKASLSAPPSSSPRKGRPPAPEEDARRHQVQIRVTQRTEDKWRAFVARLQSEQTIGIVPQGDALAWLLDEEARWRAAQGGSKRAARA